MRIKGHSIIELKDIHTGKVERYEDDNMLTNAISYIIKDLGMLWSSPLKVSTNVRQEPIKHLLGGLLLLGDNITENANTIFVPAGISMIGNGAAGYTANSDDGVTEFGSWNYDESKWLSDGSYKMVWDFTGPQALGTIKCACLTSNKNGYIGIGNATSGYARQSVSTNTLVDNRGTNYNVDTVSGSLLNRIVNVNTTACTITYVDYYNIYYNSDHTSEHMSTTGKLKLITQKIPIGKYDIRQTYPYNYVPSQTPTPPASQSFIPVTTTEVALPSDFLTALGVHTPYYIGKYGNYYYMMAGAVSGLQPQGVVRGVKIDCSTLAATSFTVSNYTNTAFSFNDYDISFGNNTFACYSNNSRMVFQDLTDNSDTDEVTCSIYRGGSGIDASCCNTFMREESWMMGTEPQYRIDMGARTVTPTNGIAGGRYGRVLSTTNPLLYDYLASDSGYWNDYGFSLSYVTDYIATINNLSEPVTKTADKTMKVTYILHFDVS